MSMNDITKVTISPCGAYFDYCGELERYRVEFPHGPHYVSDLKHIPGLLAGHSLPADTPIRIETPEAFVERLDFVEGRDVEAINRKNKTTSKLIRVVDRARVAFDEGHRKVLDHSLESMFDLLRIPPRGDS